MIEVNTVEEWLGADNKIGQDIWNRKYRYKDESFPEWLDRVSMGDEELRDLIASRKFLFGGRILANIGTEESGSTSNCYSRGYVEDDLEDIMKTTSDLAFTYAAQGGQGVSLSKIRPKGTSIRGRYEADGLVPWIRLYNTVTGCISQAGARKGALLVSLDVRHKDAEEFITLKSNCTEATKCNLSVEIDDLFMTTVELSIRDGVDYSLHEIREYSGHKIEYDIYPLKLFKLICQTAWDWGEPGLMFVNRFRNYNLMQYVDGYNIVTANPCKPICMA